MEGDKESGREGGGRLKILRARSLLANLGPISLTAKIMNNFVFFTVPV